MGRKNVQEEKRIRIMEALNLCLQEKSFDQTSIKDIARAAEVNHGLLHYYFKSKEDILINYIDFVILHYKATFETLLAEKAAEDPDEKHLLEWFFQTMNERITLNRRLSKVFVEIWEIASYNPDVREKVRLAYREWMAWVTGLLNRVVRDPAVARRIGTAVVAFLEGMSLFTVILDPEELALDEVLADFQKRIIQML
ncbi:MAG: TetR/AcrR family transcriptional regulator [Desulfobacterales bacterium]|nr:TetR/AcrR family transcriptional regulator [Desulfobacterales bacterium]